MTRRPFPLHAGLAEVVAIADLTPSMRRFTLRADAFAGFGVEQPGEIVTLGWPAPGRELVLPRSRWRFPPGTPEDQRLPGAAAWGQYPGGLTVDKGDPLFPRIKA